MPSSPAPVVFKSAHRKKHFAFFNAMARPHFGITANVDITEFLGIVRQSSALRFTPAIVYLLTRAALEVEPFSWRVRGGKVVRHANLRPSFAVPTREAGVFSFCTVAYHPDPAIFHADCEAEMQRRLDEPSMEDEAGADDYLFMSTFPWASFTSVTHAMPGTERQDSVPRIVWGKYFPRGHATLMPLGVQAHHAIVDGADLGAYYQKTEDLLQRAAEIFRELV